MRWNKVARWSYVGLRSIIAKPVSTNSSIVPSYGKYEGHQDKAQSVNNVLVPMLGWS